MRNDFEIRRTFWPANHRSLVGHFEIAPDISCRKRKPLQDIFYIQTEKCNFFTGYFAQFPLPGHFVRQEFTPSPDIWNFRRSPARPADFAYSVQNANWTTIIKMVSFSSQKWQFLKKSLGRPYPLICTGVNGENLRFITPLYLSTKRLSKSRPCHRILCQSTVQFNREQSSYDQDRTT